jgi:hypothetical protein
MRVARPDGRQPQPGLFLGYSSTVTKGNEKNLPHNTTSQADF